MKVRNGFVSNSSSSSFCIYGADFDLNDLIEKIKKSNFLTENELEELEENDEWYELGGIIAEKSDLDFYLSEDCAWIGKSWRSIGDDETGKQFKEKVRSKIEKILGTDIECDTHEEEIYS